jgi:hypothetical protein
VLGSGAYNPSVTFVIPAGRTLTIVGDSLSQGGAMGGSGAVSIVNQGTIDFAGSTLTFLGGLRTLVNDGVLKKSNAAASVSIKDLSGSSSGTLQSLAGELELDGSGVSSPGWTISGSVQAAPGATVRLNAATTLGPSFSFGGGGRLVFGGWAASVVRIDSDLSIANLDIGPPGPTGCGTGCGYGKVAGGGNLTLTGVSRWGLVTQTGTGRTTIAPGAVVELNDATDFSGGRTLVNDGTLNINAPRLFLDATLTNNGLLDIKTDSSGTNGLLRAVPSVVNSGTIKKSSGSGVSYMGNGIADNVLYVSSGTLRVETGTLYFTRDNESVRQTAGSIELAGGHIALSGVGGRINLTGGLVKGAGTITGSVTNGGTVSPGFSAAQVTIAKDYTQTGVFTVEIGGPSPGTQHDQLVVAGAVVLGGGLTVACIDAFLPSPGDPFVLIDKSSAGAVGGTFLGLPEGKVFASGARTWKMSYVAGNGNDVGVTFQFDGVHGDLDKSGTIDVFDLVTLASHIVGNAPAGAPPFLAPSAAADVDRSGVPDVFDLVQLAGYIVGNVPSLPL